ncbi:MAG: helix-hairpin-helix domain-containing protein [Actinomycetota bacterium]
MLDVEAASPLGWIERAWARRALWLRVDALVTVGVVVTVAVVGWLWWAPSSSAEPPERVEDALPLAATPAPPPVEVHVHAAGAVVRPGLYRLPDGARVADLLEAAGGVTDDADLDRVNLAAPVTDGAQLFVPRRGEPVVAIEGATASSQASGGPIDLNLAGAAELESLPGIGPSTSAAIIAHRERDGPFATVDELLEVRGIGPAKLDAIRDLVVVG